MEGKIAVVDRGECTWAVKFKLAKDAGALAVIVVNTGLASEELITMTGLPADALQGYFVKATTGYMHVTAQPESFGSTNIHHCDGQGEHGLEEQIVF